MTNPKTVAVPVEPTPEMIAAGALAAIPVPSESDILLAAKAAKIVLMTPGYAHGPGATVESLAAAISTMIPSMRAMIAAAPTPPAGEPGISEYERGLRDGYERRQMEVQAALA